MRADGGRSWARSLRLVSLVLVVLAALGLVLASPLALTALDDTDERDWQRLSEIGQTYGAVSALLSAMALGAVAISLVIQTRSAKLDRLQAHRTFHLELVKMAIEDEDLRICWGSPLVKTGVPDVERKQQLYCNQIVSWWEMTFEVGGDTEDALRQAAAGLFTSDVSRRWWGRQRTYRKGATSRGKRLHRILNEEWMLATLNHEARAAAAHAETGASEWE